MTHQSADRAEQFRQIRAGLTWGWSIIAVCLAIATRNSWPPEVPLSTEITILAIGVAIIGVPHGALDHRVAEDVLKARFPSNWLSLFSIGYLSLAALVLVGFWLAAPLMLVLFLLASVLHFGLGDASYVEYPAPLAWIEIVLMGAIPIILPWVIFTDDVAMLFGWLANTDAVRWQNPFSATWVISLFLLALIAFFTVRFFRKAAGSTLPIGGSPTETAREERTRFVVELLCTLALFATLSPLLAFTWYFCGLHAPRHLLALAERLLHTRQRTPWAALGWVLLQSLPLTLITIAGAVFGLHCLQSQGLEAGLESGIEANRVRVIFWGLAALTFPHMLLTAIWDHQLGNPFQRL